MFLNRGVCLMLLFAWAVPAGHAQLVVSADEAKYRLDGKHAGVVSGANLDSLTVLNFREFPPITVSVPGVANSVIGPPSNVVLTPDSTRALVASSIYLDPLHLDGYRADYLVQLVDLDARHPGVTSSVRVDKQPSGLSITPDGKLAIIACRQSNTVSLIRIDDRQLIHLGNLVVCEMGESPTDVAITPDGRSALVVMNQGQYLRALDIDGERVTTTERRLSVFGQPYRCDISGDGRFAAVSGGGKGNGRDANAISFVDLDGDGMQTVQYVAVGYGLESCAFNPNGKLVAVTLINGSGASSEDPQYREHGLVALLEQDDRGNYAIVQEVPVGRIPQGVVFTADGQYVVVQCHADKELWLLRVEDDRLVDTGERVPTAGHPSGIAASR